MPTLQQFLCRATQKAADDLVAALLRVPEEKRHWCFSDTTRSALDQVAECALINAYTVDLIKTYKWPMPNAAAFKAERAKTTAGSWDQLETLLQQNTHRLVEAISDVSDDALGVEVQLPWHMETVAEIIAWGHWNMTYHQGQINYIASLLGTSD